MGPSPIQRFFRRVWERVVREIVEPTLRVHRGGFPVQVVLFSGLCLRRGTETIGVHVRFGDPETQAILVRLKRLVDIFRATIAGNLDQLGIEWSEESSVHA